MLLESSLTSPLLVPASKWSWNFDATFNGSPKVANFRTVCFLNIAKIVILATAQYFDFQAVKETFDDKTFQMMGELTLAEMTIWLMAIETFHAL